MAAKDTQYGSPPAMPGGVSIDSEWVNTRVLAPSRAIQMALGLGYAGLIPFVAGAALSWLLPSESRPLAAAGLSVYATVIVAFLGGIHWGIGFREGRPGLFLWGVLPAMMAAAALSLPVRYGLLVDGVLLLLCYAVDRRVYPSTGLETWLTLRWRLSLVAATSCFIAAAQG